MAKQAPAAASPGHSENPAPGLGRKPRPAPLDMERVVSVASAESFVPELALPEPISKYESDPPGCEPLGARPAALAAVWAVTCNPVGGRFFCMPEMD